MRSEDRLFWIWLSEALGAGNRDFKRLIDLYKTPYEIFNAEEAELERVPEISGKTVERLSDKSLSHAVDVLEMCEKLGIGILTYEDALFPQQLKEIGRPPALLYYKGTPFAMEDCLTVGMVGTRRMSAYGLHNAYKIAYRLAFAGAVVVSGMATGIDGVSAAAAIRAGGKTVAILGCGLDLVYPRHHVPLMREIERTSLVLSEYPPGTPPNHYHFPVRNRLISGLSRTTVVVEAGLKSGSLITAKDAISQGKTVFAVPANVGSPAAEGSNGLLRDGARVAVCAEDVLNLFEYSYAKTLRIARLVKLKEDDSEADLHYLDRLGVIDLVKPKTEDSPKTEEEKPQKPSKPKEKRAKKDDAPKGGAESILQKEEQTQKIRKQTPEEVLAALSVTQRAVFEAMPDDRAFSVDALSEVEYPYGEIMAALTMLEIMGLIQKLPGALYTKL